MKNYIMNCFIKNEENEENFNYLCKKNEQDKR